MNGQCQVQVSCSYWQCQECQSDADCGNCGYRCMADAWSLETGWCGAPCGSASDCPGNLPCTTGYNYGTSCGLGYCFLSGTYCANYYLDPIPICNTQ